ncbi:MAG: hypothetical protein AAF368_00305 [Planctomycetota bacterium]
MGLTRVHPLVAARAPEAVEGVGDGQAGQAGQSGLPARVLQPGEARATATEADHELQVGVTSERELETETERERYLDSQLSSSYFNSEIESVRMGGELEKRSMDLGTRSQRLLDQLDMKKSGFGVMDMKSARDKFKKRKRSVRNEEQDKGQREIGLMRENLRRKKREEQGQPQVIEIQGDETEAVGGDIRAEDVYRLKQYKRARSGAEGRGAKEAGKRGSAAREPVSRGSMERRSEKRGSATRESSKRGSVEAKKKSQAVIRKRRRRMRGKPVSQRSGARRDNVIDMSAFNDMVLDGLESKRSKTSREKVKDKLRLFPKPKPKPKRYRDMLKSRMGGKEVETVKWFNSHLEPVQVEQFYSQRGCGEPEEDGLAGRGPERARSKGGSVRSEAKESDWGREASGEAEDRESAEGVSEEAGSDEQMESEKEASEYAERGEDEPVGTDAREKNVENERNRIIFGEDEDYIENEREELIEAYSSEGETRHLEALRNNEEVIGGESIEREAMEEVSGMEVEESVEHIESFERGSSVNEEDNEDEADRGEDNETGVYGDKKDDLESAGEERRSESEREESVEVREADVESQDSELERIVSKVKDIVKTNMEEEEMGVVKTPVAERSESGERGSPQAEAEENGREEAPVEERPSGDEESEEEGEEECTVEDSEVEDSEVDNAVAEDVAERDGALEEGVTSGQEESSASDRDLADEDMASAEISAGEDDTEVIESEPRPEHPETSQSEQMQSEAGASENESKEDTLQNEEDAHWTETEREQAESRSERGAEPRERSGEAESEETRKSEAEELIEFEMSETKNYEIRPRKELNDIIDRMRQSSRADEKEDSVTGEGEPREAPESDSRRAESEDFGDFEMSETERESQDERKGSVAEDDVAEKMGFSGGEIENLVTGSSESMAEENWKDSRNRFEETLEEGDLENRSKVQIGQFEPKEELLRTDELVVELGDEDKANALGKSVNTLYKSFRNERASETGSRAGAVKSDASGVSGSQRDNRSRRSFLDELRRLESSMEQRKREGRAQREKQQARRAQQRKSQEPARKVESRNVFLENSSCDHERESAQGIEGGSVRVRKKRFRLQKKHKKRVRGTETEDVSYGSQVFLHSTESQFNVHKKGYYTQLVEKGLGKESYRRMLFQRMGQPGQSELEEHDPIRAFSKGGVRGLQKRGIEGMKSQPQYAQVGPAKARQGQRARSADKKSRKSRHGSRESGSRGHSRRSSEGRRRKQDVEDILEDMDREMQRDQPHLLR